MPSPERPVDSRAVSFAARVRGQLAKRAPRLEEAAVRANWRLRNRSRSFSPDGLDPKMRGFVDALARDGVVTGRFEDLFGDRALFDEAAAREQQMYEAPREEADAEAGSKASYLTKLA